MVPGYWRVFSKLPLVVHGAGRKTTSVSQGAVVQPSSETARHADADAATPAWRPQALRVLQEVQILPQDLVGRRRDCAWDSIV